MIGRYEAILNDIALSSVAPEILILDINYAQPRIMYETYTSARRQGARIYRRSIDRTTVSISFEIHAYDTKRRQAICDAVQQWAKDGGILTTNDRVGQRLRCVCDMFPTINSVLKWTEPVTVAFSAYTIPFWEQDIPTTATLTAGTSGSAYMYVPGVVEDAVVEVEAVSGGALTSLSLTVNNRTLSLSGISVASGGKVVISYDDNMIQSIKTGSTSLLNKRTGVDDLLANCGKSNAIGFTSNVSCTVTFKVRGLWL